MSPAHTLLFLDPGHFHAALTLRVPQPRVNDEVFVYAREGAELREFLTLVERFNRRSLDPTRWRPVVTACDDPLERLLAERRGDVVILAGRNGGKARTMRRLHEAGFHVLADKPWLVEPADLEHVPASLDGWPVAAESKTWRPGSSSASSACPPSSARSAVRRRRSGRRACTTWRSWSTARRSGAPGGTSTCACRAAVRSTFRRISSTRPSGSWTATERRRRSSPLARGRRPYRWTPSRASPARQDSRLSWRPSSTTTRSTIAATPSLCTGSVTSPRAPRRAGT